MTTPNDIELVNQFGEKTFNKVDDAQAFADFLPGRTLAAKSVMANITAAEASEAEVTLQAFVDISPAKTGVEAITAIADPATATAEDCANKINEILAALKVEA